MDRPKRPPYQGHSHQNAPRHQQGGNPRYKGVRHPSSNLTYDVYHAGSRRLNRHTSLDLFFLAVLGGAFLAAGTLLTVLLSNGMINPTTQHIVGALGLTTGMLLVILTNSVLVTEPNIYIPGNFEHLSIVRACMRLFRFWLIAWVGNFVGAFLIGLFIYLSQEYSAALQQTVANVTNMKLTYANGSLRSTGQLIISGMLANWLIATATYFAIASRNLVNQFILFFLVFVLIIAANFQYYPANLGYFLLSSFFGNQATLLDAIFLNLIPVTLGNILGASLLASGSMIFLSKKRSSSNSGNPNYSNSSNG